MDLGLNGRNAVVCASSQGLGRACALELARAGCTVVVNGRHAETLERTATEIRKESGARVIAVVADVTTPEAQEALGRLGFDVVASSPDEFARWIRAESEKWAAVVRASGATAD